MVLEIFLYGFITAFGWWTANHYVIEPHFPPPIERKQDEQNKGNATTSRCSGQSAGTGDHCGSESSRHADLPSGKNQPQDAAGHASST